VRGDLIAIYKILTGLDRIDSERMSPMMGESRTRAHSLRTRGNPFRTELRRNFFTQRVVNVWNSLPQNVVEAKTLRDFTEKLDRALGVKGKRDMGGSGIRKLDMIFLLMFIAGGAFSLLLQLLKTFW